MQRKPKVLNEVARAVPEPSLSVIFRKEDIAQAKPPLAGKCAVVIDVLRATSTMVTALCNGATALRLVASAEEARAAAAAMPKDSFLLAGERAAIKIDGFDLGNSPREFTREKVGGKTIVFTTTNGTVALCNCAQAGAAKIIIGSLLNAEAAARAALATGLDIVFVCAGTDGEIGLDDAYTAGMIGRHVVAERRAGLWHDSFRIARQLLDVHEKAGPMKPVAALLTSKAGTTLLGLGPMGFDVTDCAELNTCSFAPVFDPQKMLVTRES